MVTEAGIRFVVRGLSIRCGQEILCIESHTMHADLRTGFDGRAGLQDQLPRKSALCRGCRGGARKECGEVVPPLAHEWRAVLEDWSGHRHADSHSTTGVPEDVRQDV